MTAARRDELPHARRRCTVDDGISTPSPHDPRGDRIWFIDHEGARHHNRQEVDMRRLNAKLIITTVAITGVIGAGVAVAADQPTCPCGNTPQAGQKAPERSDGDGTQPRLRKRDGTGPRHAQRAAGERPGNGPRQQQGPGNRGADCPYRS
jgi:hypothetical protein